MTNKFKKKILSLRITLDCFLFFFIFLLALSSLAQSNNLPVKLISRIPENRELFFNSNSPITLNFTGPVSIRKAQGNFYNFNSLTQRGIIKFVRGKSYPAKIMQVTPSTLQITPKGNFPFFNNSKYGFSIRNVFDKKKKPSLVKIANIEFFTNTKASIPEPTPIPTPTIPQSNPNNPLSRAVLGAQNFTYLGSFKVPTNANNDTTSFSGGGLAHRIVNGQLRLFTTGHVYRGGQVFEIDTPELKSVAPLNTATVLKNWGDIYNGKKLVFNEGGTNALTGGVITNGLYYDQKLNRLYWSYGHWYNTENSNNPSVGFSNLNDETGVATGVGAWNFNDLPEKMARGGVFRIPLWFANTYTAGKALGIGLGGYYSIIASGSAGISLAATSDPDLTLNPHATGLSNIPLMGFPFDVSARMIRNNNYVSFYDGGNYPTIPGLWNSNNGKGFWTWSDMYRGSAVWIDNLPKAHGLLVIGKIGEGNVWYEGSTLHAERGSFSWYTIDPKDLALSAEGKIKRWQVQPTNEWKDPNLNLTLLDQNGWAGEGFSVVSATYVEETSTLYVLVTMAYKNGVEYFPEIRAFKVS